MTGTPEPREPEPSRPGFEEECRLLRGQLRDLLAVLPLPALWRGWTTAQIAGDLLEVLVSLLRLDLAYVRIAGNGSPALEVCRPQSGERPPAVDAALAAEGSSFPLEIAAEASGLRVLKVEQHFLDEQIVVVAGSRRPGFPRDTESFLLRVAVDQAAIAVHGALLLARELEARTNAEQSELKRMESALRAALDESWKFVSLAEESSELIAVAGLDQRVQFVNRGGQAMVGLGGPENVHRTIISDYVFPEDHDATQQLLARVREKGRHAAEVRFRNFKTGQVVPVWCTVFLLRNRQNGEPVAYGTVSHDLTEQKQAAEVRERVLGIVGHDLRNPLLAITMGAGLLSKDAGLPAGSSRTARRILTSAHRMDQIIRDVLDLTRARLGGGLDLLPAPEDAHLVCARIVDELRLAHPGRELRLQTSGDGRGVWDSGRLEQVVSNLAANALQYGPIDSPVELESRGEDAYWQLSVHNFGAPIPADQLPHIFDPFKRVGVTNERNLGLGLFIAREVVLKHGGTIAVRSVAPEGTTFVVRLPRQPKP